MSTRLISFHNLFNISMTFGKFFSSYFKPSVTPNIVSIFLANLSTLDKISILVSHCTFNCNYPRWNNDIIFESYVEDELFSDNAFI